MKPSVAIPYYPTSMAMALAMDAAKYVNEHNIVDFACDIAHIVEYMNGVRDQHLHYYLVDVIIQIVGDHTEAMFYSETSQGDRFLSNSIYMNGGICLVPAADPQSGLGVKWIEIPFEEAKRIIKSYS